MNPSIGHVIGTREIDMEILCGGLRSHRPRVHRAQPERTTDDCTGRVEGRRLHVQGIEQWVAIDEVSDSRGSAADMNIRRIRRRHRRVVRLRHERQSIGRDRSRQNREAFLEKVVARIVR